LSAKVIVSEIEKGVKNCLKFLSCFYRACFCR